MNTSKTDATKFETISFSSSDTVAHNAGRHLTAQFWACVTMSCFLLLHGARLLVSARYLSPESLERQGSFMIAIVYGMMLPSFLYFAWQARRQSKSEGTVTIER